MDVLGKSFPGRKNSKCKDLWPVCARCLEKSSKKRRMIGTEYVRARYEGEKLERWRSEGRSVGLCGAL